MRITNPIGKKGEDLAVLYLKEQGYKILERNFRKQYGEIDIIALESSTKDEKNEQTLVFVEVKTRTSSQFGTPFEAITSYKLKPLLKTAELYAISHKGLPDGMRMDAIAVILNDKLEQIDLEHIKNISEF